jgi:hypothetical protein
MVIATGEYSRRFQIRGENKAARRRPNPRKPLSQGGFRQSKIFRKNL